MHNLESFLMAHSDNVFFKSIDFTFLQLGIAFKYTHERQSDLNYIPHLHDLITIFSAYLGLEDIYLRFPVRLEENVIHLLPIALDGNNTDICLDLISRMEPGFYGLDSLLETATQKGNFELVKKLVSLWTEEDYPSEVLISSVDFPRILRFLLQNRKNLSEILFATEVASIKNYRSFVMLIEDPRVDLAELDMNFESPYKEFFEDFIKKYPTFEAKKLLLPIDKKIEGLKKEGDSFIPFSEVNDLIAQQLYQFSVQHWDAEIAKLVRLRNKIQDSLES
jgi:hypothetical protein